MAIRRLLPLFLLVLACCGKKPSGYDYKVALDPSWYSLAIQGREATLTAFTYEIIEAIGKEENLKIGVYERSWDNLILGLQENEYQAICSSMEPYVFYEKLYLFSSIYLPTGPVLVVNIGSKIDSLSQLGGKEVGILSGSSYGLILEKFPTIIQRTYSSIQAALDDVKENNIAAAFMGILSAEAYTNDLFAGRLKISSPPLTEEGVRLVGLSGKSEKLIYHFNRGLSRLKANGTYNKIAKKWGLEEAK